MRLNNETSAKLEKIERLIFSPLKTGGYFYSKLKKFVLSIRGDLLFRKILEEKEYQNSDGNLCYLYDLNYYPNSFDLVYCLMVLDSESKKINKGFSLVIVSDTDGTQLLDEWHVLGKSSKLFRETNLLVPIAKMFKRCSAVCLFSDRTEALQYCSRQNIFHVSGVNPFNEAINVDLFDINYNDYDGIEVPHYALNLVSNWLNFREIKSNIVSMTIRNQNFQLERNTDLEFYKEILLFMVSKGYEIVVIPDTSNFFDVDFVRDWPKCTIFPEASTNVLLRAAIYQLSSINIFPAGGPATLAHANKKCKSVSILNQIDGVETSTMEYWEKEGTLDNNFQFLNDQKQVVLFNPTSQDVKDNIIKRVSR